jgi:hypothetical protein
MFGKKEHEEENEIERLIRGIYDIAHWLKVLVSFQGVQSLVFIQIGENMAVSQNLIGLTPGTTAKFQIVPRDANQNAIALDAGSTLTYLSSDPVNAPASADPADPSGLTMLVPVAAGIPSAPGNTVFFTATASLQKNGKTPTTGAVPVSILPVASSGAVDMIFNQLS